LRMTGAGGAAVRCTGFWSLQSRRATERGGGVCVYALAGGSASGR